MLPITIRYCLQVLPGSPIPRSPYAPTHRRALSRAVAAQEAQHLSLVDRKRNVVDRALGTVTLGYVLEFDHALALLNPRPRNRSRT